MNRMTRFIGLAIGMVGFCAAFVAAQDWPQWRGPNRDGKAAAFTAPQTWPETLTQAWQVEAGQQNDASPALVGDKLFVVARQGGNEVTMCLNAATGETLWKKEYPVAAITGAAARAHSGPRSTPAVAEGKVVTLSVNGVLSCLNAADGELAWRKEDYAGQVPRFYTSSSPLIVDGLAVAQLGGPDRGVIAAYDLQSGQPKWKYEGAGPGYASPVVMTAEGVKQIVALTDKDVVGVSLADGTLLWQIPFAAEGRNYNAATPIVDGQTVIYTGAGRGIFAVKIEKQDDAFAVKPLWNNAEVAVQYNTPVLKDGLLFGLSDKGFLFCLDAANGQTKWTDTTKYSNFGEIVVAGPVLMALPSKGELVVYKPDGQKYEQVAKYKVAETDVYAAPVVSGNRIFVQDQQAVTLWTVK